MMGWGWGLGNLPPVTYLIYAAVRRTYHHRAPHALVSIYARMTYIVG